ncbi:MAG: hypothetical protein MNPFHGCM_03031 [Gemmatimonadaceae bacterium]|nr:hypothetical protein [Gemmatimonadaceae bacterium]
MDEAPPSHTEPNEINRAIGTIVVGRPNVLWLVVAGAFVGAIGEVGARYVARAALDRPTFLNPNAIWLGPLLNLAVLAVPSLLICIASRKDARPLRLAFLASILVSFEILLLVPRIAPWATVLLAIGISAQAARVVARWPGPLLVLARATAVVLMAASWSLGLGGLWQRRQREARLLDRLPPSRADARNIVLVVLDAVRAESMGLYGGPPATTPFLTAYASHCIDYRRAIAPSPWTLPSHGSMFTGRWPRDLAADWDVPLGARFPTIAELLTARGYATGAAVGNFLYTYHEFGLSRGFAHYDDYGTSPDQAGARNVVADYLARGWNRVAGDYLVPGRKRAGRISRDILGWMDAQAAANRPYFAFVNWYDAHDPYAPSSPWRHAFLQSEPPTRSIENVVARPDAPEVEGLRNAYRGAVAYLDTELDSLVRGLQERGMLDRTLLIVTADHGEEFAEHERLQHGYTLYFPAIHVPLLICPPTGDSLVGQVIDTPVSLRDLGQTILAAAGHDADSGAIPGFDLLELARTSAACRSPAISYLRRPRGSGPWFPGSKRELASIIGNRYHLIRTDEGREELYDIASDRWEQHDLIATPAGSRIAATLRLQLDQPGDCRRT